MTVINLNVRVTLRVKRAQSQLSCLVGTEEGDHLL